MTSSGAADGAERSLWGLEMKSECHRPAQAGDWGQRRMLHRCSFPLSSEEEPKLYFQTVTWSFNILTVFNIFNVCSVLKQLCCRGEGCLSSLLLLCKVL